MEFLYIVEVEDSVDNVGVCVFNGFGNSIGVGVEEVDDIFV